VTSPDHFRDLEGEDHGIYFHYHDVLPLIDFEENAAKQWLEGVLSWECKIWHRIDYIFCSDQVLLSLNQSYLQHDTFTDIMTFPFQQDPLIAEIYISLERISENATLYSSGLELNELARVMVHGILHLCGYDDHRDTDIMQMRAKESFYLQKRD
jgi:rRNA maturation RNase YbeY